MTERIERFVYDDAIVRMFLLAHAGAGGWSAPSSGWPIALQLLQPDVQLRAAVDQLRAAAAAPHERRDLRLRGQRIFAAVYYSSQRLFKATAERAAEPVHFWGWQAIIVSAAITLPLGITQSKEYAELEWPSTSRSRSCG